MLVYLGLPIYKLVFKNEILEEEKLKLIYSIFITYINIVNSLSGGQKT